MRMYLDMAEVGNKWHPVDGTDDETLRRELVLAPMMQYADSVKSRLSVWKRWVRSLRQVAMGGDRLLQCLCMQHCAGGG